MSYSPFSFPCRKLRCPQRAGRVGRAALRTNGDLHALAGAREHNGVPTGWTMSPPRME